jgi:Fur family ferric uptake transcriptional regulator
MKHSRKRLPCGRVRSIADRKAQISFQYLTNKLNRYLSKHRLKKSHSRLAIMDVIFRHARHFSIPDLVQLAQIHRPDIAFATIYRSVPVLLSAGILKKSLSDESGHTIYELDSEVHHDHIICKNCAEVFEFHSPAIETQLSMVAGSYELSLTVHEHVLWAECSYFQRES